MRKTWALFVSLVVAFASLVFAQPAAAVTNFTVTVVASGGSPENTNWSFANGEITPSATVSINASDIVGKLSTGSVVVFSGRILVNTNIVHATANNLTFKSTGNIIVGGGLTIQSQGGDVIFNSDSDANNTGHVRMGFDATCTMGNVNTNGGDIIVGGGANPRTTTAWAQNTDAHSTACLAAGPVSGVALYNYSFNAAGGDISVRGAAPTIAGNPSSRGINMNGSGAQTATIQTSGAGTIYFYGDGNLILNNTAWGVAVNSAISVVTGSGDITFEGRGNPAGPTNARGVAVGAASTFTSSTGNISFLDRTNGALAGYTGIFFGGAITATTAGDFAVQADEIAQVGALTLDVDNASIGANTTSSFTAVYSTGVINAINSNSLSIGAPGNTSAVVLGAAITTGGPIAVNASTVTVNAALTATSAPITFNTTGGVTQNSTITASALNLAGTATYNTQAFTVAGGSAQTVFTANFNSQGGSAVAPVVFASGAALTLPAPPVREGFEFTGWYASAAGGSAFTTPHSPGVAADVTLFAQWILEGSGAKVANWTIVTGKQGETIRLSIVGSGLNGVSRLSASSGTLRIVAQTAERIDFEIAGAALGIGTLRIVSLTQDLAIAGAFSISAPEPVVLKSVTSRVSFANNSAVLSAQASRQLLASLKTISSPESVVVSGSVATARLTATSRALATKRANAVAAIIRQQFAGVDVRVVVAPARGVTTANNNAVVTFRVPASKN